MSFTFLRPRSLPEVMDLLQEQVEGTHLLAGGTDLMVLLERKKVEPKRLISLQDVAELTGIRADDSGLHLGALVTHRKVEQSPHIRGALVALPEACATVGGVTTRNMGTLAGNLVNASPAADTPPPLLCMGATVTIQGLAGERKLPLDQFFLGYRKTALQPGEVLTAIHIPAQAPHSATAFLKLGRRQAMEISVVCVAAHLTLAEDGRTIREARVALGAMAPNAIRSREAESLLVGREADSALFEEAGRLAAAETRPIDDLRASANYRRKTAAVLVARALAISLGRARSL